MTRALYWSILAQIKKPSNVYWAFKCCGLSLFVCKQHEKSSYACTRRPWLRSMAIRTYEHKYLRRSLLKSRDRLLRLGILSPLLGVHRCTLVGYMREGGVCLCAGVVKIGLRTAGQPPLPDQGPRPAIDHKVLVKLCLVQECRSRAGLWNRACHFVAGY